MPLRPIYYDTETTGVRPEKDRIVEIAAFDPYLNKTFQFLVNPGMPIPKEASSIHGITDEMVAEAPSFKEVGAAFVEFCHGEVALIAHNNDGFDKHFLDHEFKRNSLTLPSWPMIDSLKWSRKYRSDLPKHQLQFLRQMYGIAENQAHRALDDVFVLHEVFKVMIDDLPLETVIELLSAPASAIEHMPFGKHQGKLLKDVPSDYVAWLKTQGALDKPENAPLKQAFDSLGFFEPKKVFA